MKHLRVFVADDVNDFDGMWSTYPFLPSGVVVCSDRQGGLFLVRDGAVARGSDHLGNTGQDAGIAIAGRYAGHDLVVQTGGFAYDIAVANGWYR